MGYITDVTMVIKCDKSKMAQRLVEFAVTHPSEWNRIKEVESTWDEDTFYLVACGKWYGEYAEVNAAETLWNWMEEEAEEDDNLYGCYVKVGEDLSDNSESYFNEGYDLAYIERRIAVECDVPFGRLGEDDE